MKKLLWTGLFFAPLLWALLSFPGMATQGSYDSIAIDFREDVPATEIEAELRSIAAEFGESPHLNSAFSQADHLYVVKGSDRLLKALRRSNLKRYAESIEPNYIWKAYEAPNDPDYVKQWNLRSINIESAWNETHGQGVTIAVIDTGISAVPDLDATRIVAGYDFVGDREDATDDNGHGTHVAGTIAQSTNNEFGVAGIAYEAALMPLKVLGAGGGGTVADIAEAIRFAADHGADVINMSLGGGGDTEVMREAIDYATSKGVVIVAAAGNENNNSVSYPSRYPNVISVAALNPAGQRAEYSNFGAGVDIAAPGGGGTTEADGILQNTIDPTTGESVFTSLQGTSMAAPHVAGVAALIKASGIEEPQAIAQIIKQSARSMPNDELNHYGAGQLDADAAVKLALKGQITPKDFWRWLNQNGYLNLRFWFDGGVVALLPKIGMVIGSYLLAFFLRNYLPGWSFALSSGLVMGSAGLFPLRGLYRYDLPQFPFRILGSSIPELGSAIQASPMLNPIFASVLVPLVLVALLLGHQQWRWFAIGSTLGVAACLAVSAIVAPSVLWLGSGLMAQTFLSVNALLCFGLAYLAAKAETA